MAYLGIRVTASLEVWCRYCLFLYFSTLLASRISRISCETGATCSLLRNRCLIEVCSLLKMKHSVCFLGGITKKYKAYNLLVLENDRKRHNHLHSCLHDVFIVDIDKFDGAFIYICSGLINVLQ